MLAAAEGFLIFVTQWPLLTVFLIPLILIVLVAVFAIGAAPLALVREDRRYVILDLIAGFAYTALGAIAAIATLYGHVRIGMSTPADRIIAVAAMPVLPAAGWQIIFSGSGSVWVGWLLALAPLPAGLFAGAIYSLLIGVWRRTRPVADVFS